MRKQVFPGNRRPRQAGNRKRPLSGQSVKVSAVSIVSGRPSEILFRNKV